MENDESDQPLMVMLVVVLVSVPQPIDQAKDEEHDEAQPAKYQGWNFVSPFALFGLLTSQETSGGTFAFDSLIS